MKSLERILITSMLAGTAATAAEPVWQHAPASAVEWEDALPARDGNRVALILDTPALSRLRAAIVPPAAPAGTETAGELLTRFAKRQEAGLKIEWFNGTPPATGFSRAFRPEDGQVRSTYQLGDTTLTRTTIASDLDQAVFLHFLADKPGALSFRVSVETPAESEVRIEDRRQLIFSPQQGPASHVWVIPFESDVATEGRAIAIRGEGEALVIWSFAAGADAPKSLAGTLARLGARYDPGHTPPDPVRIWHGLLESRTKSAKNSP